MSSASLNATFSALADPIRRAIDIDERLPLAQTASLSLQHLFAMFDATVLVPFSSK